MKGKNEMKKILAVLMVMALMFVMTTPAYAAELGDTDTVTPIEIIVDYAWVIFAAIVCLVILALVIIAFIQLPRAAQLKKVQEWLLIAVFEAEKRFGADTGVIKLRFVFDIFVSKFPWVAKIITFEKFTNLVNKALEKMERLLAENPDTYMPFVLPDVPVSPAPSESYPIEHAE